ncbi:MAG: hypothetical protein ACHQNT_05320 [Bacteroidia bacterium]
MKKFISSLLFTATFFICGGSAFSQAGVGIGTGGFGIGMHVPLNSKKAQRNKNLDKQVDQLKHDLNLNDEQVVKVRSLLIERERSHNGGGKNAMAKEQFNLRMQEILTTEQYTKFNEPKQQKREGKEEVKDEKKKEPTPPEEWDDVYR